MTEKQKFHIECFSKGLYSNWFWHTPSRTLFDCGEGFATYAGNYIFGVERICISHAAHGDHIAGLAAFIGIRNSSRGDKEKPLEIYYPHDDFAINDYKNFIKARFGSWLNFKIEWIPLMVGQKIPLDKTHWIESFKLSHTKKSTTLGYKIVESRTRLKAGIKPEDIPNLLKSGAVKSSELNEGYTANTFAYCLDAYNLAVEDVFAADLAIMDCSFLNKNDRDESTHFTLPESIQFASDAKFKNWAVAHISSRYNQAQIKELTKNIPDNAFVISPFIVNNI